MSSTHADTSAADKENTMSELREALEAAVTEQESTNEPATTPEVSTPASEAPAAEPIQSPEPEAVEPDAPKTESVAPESKAPDTAVKEAKAPAEDQKGLHRVDRAPASWKKEAKGEWNALPLQVRQEVYRREMEVSRVMQETAQARQQVEQINRTVAPFMARIQSSGVTPVEAIDQLLKADYTLATAPKAQRAEFMAKLVADYDVDIASLDAAIVARMQGRQAPQQQGFDPNQIQQLVQQQLQQALAPMYQQQQQQQQEAQQKAVTTVEQMSLDPQYPYFDEVRDEMADLMQLYSQRGVYISLPEAYNKVVVANPTIAAQQARQASVIQANQQHQLAQKAKVAASSVTGAPASGGSQAFAGDGSLRGAIEAAFSGARV